MLTFLQKIQYKLPLSFISYKMDFATPTTDGQNCVLFSPDNKVRYTLHAGSAVHYGTHGLSTLSVSLAKEIPNAPLIRLETFKS
jgi:hypothetical protein